MEASQAGEREDKVKGGGRRLEVLALPNLLSLSRVVLTPVFIWAAVRQRPWLTFGVFLLAGATDALDGFTARALRLKTNLGLWLDPLGDKVLLTAAIVVLTLPRLSMPNVLPLWLTVTCIGRDVLIALGVFVYIKFRGRTVFPPTLAGKASTVVAVATLLLVLFYNGLGISPPWLEGLYILTAGLTALSGLHYLATGLRRFFGREGTSRN